MGHKYEDHLTGKTFEKCRILAKLGTGGMGSVWLAEHFGLGRKVAVKILPPEMGRDPEYVARFMREATTAGRMEHPNIVQIHDVGYAEGRHFIVMQYVDGESLSTVVENLGAMEPKDAARCAAGILRGLHHAHQQGVVHRDVKPDNILIAAGDQPKILDFGLAIETETALQITKDGMVVGTPYYLAPEQARGQKATPLCDVYAAGVTLYYLLTGKRPFVGATALAVLNKHIHEPPVPPMKHKADIPKPLNDIVLKMMAKKPADRYQSAGAAADDLEAYLKGKEIKVKIPARLPLGLDRLTKKQQILAAAGAGTGLLLLILLLIVAFSGGAPPPVETAPNATNPAASGNSSAAEIDRQLREVFEFEDQNKNNFAAYTQVFNKYDQFLESTTSKAHHEKATQRKKAFYDYVEKRAGEELDKALKESDPYRRLKLLQEYPPPLMQLTPIEKRIGDEQRLARGEAERKFTQDETALDEMLRTGKFKEGRPLLDRLLVVAPAESRDRLERLKSDLDRRQKDYEDAVLRKLSDRFAPVHASCEASLVKRQTAAAYFGVTKFVKELALEESTRARVETVNYEMLHNAATEKNFKDTALDGVRSSLRKAFLNTQDNLPYRIITDLQDALDLELLIVAASQGMYALSRKSTDVRLSTFGSTGRFVLNQNGLQFQIPALPPKFIEARQLHPDDLVLMAAASDDKPVQEFYGERDELSRACGVAYLYSALPERWAQAARWFKRAEGLGLQGLGLRLNAFRERGYQEVREKIAASNAFLDKRNFEDAKKLLLPLLAAWAHDPVLKEQIGRAMSAILVAEILTYDRQKEYARLKQAARTLRTTYAGLYREEDIFVPYANAMRQTGNWGPAGSLMNSEWTWENKGKVDAPAEDETGASRGFRLKPNRSMELSTVTTHGATGAAVQVQVASVYSSYAAGFKFDASSKDGKSRRLVIRDTGEVTLYEIDGTEEKRGPSAALGKKPSAGQWTELSYVAEGGDLAVFVGDRPLLLVAAPIPTDREIGLWSSVEANFRLLQLRK